MDASHFKCVHKIDSAELKPPHPSRRLGSANFITSQKRASSTLSTHVLASTTAKMAFLFDKVKSSLKDVEAKIKAEAIGKPVHAHTDSANVCSDNDSHHLHRFQSFAPQREGNEVKWYVDGCSYMWAVSLAIENAKSSIWILDW